MFVHTIDQKINGNWLTIAVENTREAAPEHIKQWRWRQFSAPGSYRITVTDEETFKEVDEIFFEISSDVATVFRAADTHAQGFFVADISGFGADKGCV